MYFMMRGMMGMQHGNDPRPPAPHALGHAKCAQMHRLGFGEPIHTAVEVAEILEAEDDSPSHAVLFGLLERGLERRLGILESTFEGSLEAGVRKTLPGRHIG